jgi:hypothetical protein
MFEKIRGDLDRFGDMCGKLRVKQDFADWIAELDAAEKEIETLKKMLAQAYESDGNKHQRVVELQTENMKLREEKEQSDKLLRNAFYDQLNLLHENSSLKHEIEILKSK